MTNDPDTTVHENERDHSVSALYRELAGQKSPRDLDRRVLAEATRAAGRQHSASAWWIRTLAWAAMLVLTVTVVLEATRVPERGAPPATAHPAPPVVGANRPAGENAEPRFDASSQNDPVSNAGSAAPQLFEPTEMESLRRAEDIARTQSRSGSQTPKSVSESVPGTEKPALPDGCLSSDRSRADTWLGCIRDLEFRGHQDLADRERDALRVVFPDLAPE